MRLKKVFTTFMALSLACTLSVPALAAEGENIFPHRYNSENGLFEMSKVSHPDKPANYRHAGPKYADGIVDYLGNGKIGVPGVDVGAVGQGDRGQTYCWGSIAYGDYMYVNTLYDAAGNTEQLFGAAGGNVGEDGYSSEIMDKISACLYRGDMFLGEEDGKAAGCALVKVNMKTGDVKLIMTNEMTEDSYGNAYGGYYAHAKGMNPQFRNAVESNGKLYFIGAPSGIPSIWEIDPSNDDAFRRVYADPEIAKNPGLIVKMIQEQRVCVSIRGLASFDGHLIVSCVSADTNPYIAISKTEDPMDGFTKIATTWVEDGTNSVEGELLGYPACHLTDSIYGGSIWEMIPFNGKLYVAMCTGTQENRPTPTSMQSFAIMEGSYTGDITKRENWTWKPVIGDKEDGAKYTFGIDPERTRSGACSMMVMGDHLYIGEYNDTEIGMVDMMTKKDPQFMADNFEEAVNLYRLDKNNNVELVVGDKTKMFPNGSLSGLRSGFGTKKVDHGNQYIWKMQAFQDKLYIGTFDESVVLHPIGQFSNGDLLEMTREDWEEQINYIKELIDAMSKDNEAGQPVEKAEEVVETETVETETVETEEVVEEAVVLSEEVETEADEQIAMLNDMVEAGEEFKAEIEANGINALTLPQGMSEENAIATETDLYKGMVLVPYLLDRDDSWTDEESVTAQANFIRLYENMYNSYDSLKVGFPDEIKGIFDELLTPETFKLLHQVGRLLNYLSDCVEGFDFYVWDGNNIQCVTRDGMGDPYNSGIRAFAANDSEENPWLSLGTANIFYGTQIWRLEGEGLNLPDTEDKEPENPENPDTGDKDPENPETGDKDPENPETGDKDPENPDTGDKDPVKPDTDNTKPGTDNTKPGTDNKQPQTGDSSNVGMWIGLIAVAGGIGAGTVVYKKKKKSM